MLKYILFDLDGTLLPMDQDEFVNYYFKTLCHTLKNTYPDSKELAKNIWIGTNNMLNNNGSITNEKCFWNKLKEIYGENIMDNKYLFDNYYENEFNLVKKTIKITDNSKKCVDILIQKGYKLILATNPLFPLSAVKNRLKWVGLDSNMFSYITSYENSTYTKTNKNYFKEILNKLEINANDCLMVGNDATEDLKANGVGINTYLITDCLINKDDVDISKLQHGSFKDFIEYTLMLPTLK